MICVFCLKKLLIGTVERKLIMDEKAYAAALVAWEAVHAEPLVAHRPKYWLEHHHVTCA